RLGVLFEFDLVWILFVFFFFQAEDGIRDATVTGVQTCALPISRRCSPCRSMPCRPSSRYDRSSRGEASSRWARSACAPCGCGTQIGRASCRERGERTVGAGG